MVNRDHRTLNNKIENFGKISRRKVLRMSQKEMCEKNLKGNK